MADFASRLRELRQLRGLRQKDVAAALDLAQTTVANYEQNMRFPDEPTLLKIADFFSVSLDHLLGRDNGGGTPAGQPTPTAPPAGTLLSRPVREYLDALRRGDTEAARRVLHSTLGEAGSIRDVYLAVIAPALEEVGRLWSQGELLISEEHAITHATLQLMATLVPTRRPDSQAIGRTRCIVLAASGETHLVGARMVADFLSLAGFAVEFLGGNLSIGVVLEALRTRPCTLVAISVTLREHIGAAEDMIRAIRADPALSCAKIIAGGQAFAGAGFSGQRFGADAYVTDADTAVGVALGLAVKMHGEDSASVG